MSATITPTRLPLGSDTDEQTAARGAGIFSASGAFIARSLKHSLRDGEGLLMAVILPVMMMLLFVYVFGGALDSTGGYVDYVVPGIILLCAGFGAASIAVEVNRDKTTGAMDRFRTLPIVGATVLVGHTVASLLRNLLATGIVIGVALLIGFRPTATGLQWLGATAVIALYILTITVLFALIGLLTRSAEAANGYGFILLFLPYVSSAFVGIDTLPEWMRGFALHQPITPVIETVRALLVGTPLEGSLLAALGWCLPILAAATALIAWRFPKRLAR